MNPILRNILLGITIIVVLYVIYYFLIRTENLSKMNPGNKEIKIDSGKLANNANSNNFAYSIWFYVSDWQYRLTESKDLVVRSQGDISNPHISMAPYENNLNINISSISPGNESSKNNCTIRNFPLQRWTHLLVSLNNRTLDVYLDGKLVRTCILSGVAKPVGESDVLITPNGGFSGWTSRFRTWSKPLNPQEVFNVYREGPGSTGTSFLDRYKLRVSYYVDNVEQGSFSF